jgi:hypothetical protein
LSFAFGYYSFILFASTYSHIEKRILKVNGEGEESAIFSSCSSSLCLLLFGFVKLAFGAVLAGIGAALSVVIACLQILYAFE